jgi:hypothetical protein
MDVEEEERKLMVMYEESGLMTYEKVLDAAPLRAGVVSYIHLTELQY